MEKLKLSLENLVVESFEPALEQMAPGTVRAQQSGPYTDECDSCGVEIGLKRLEARPTATLCIDCKTLDELRERQVAK